MSDEPMQPGISKELLDDPNACFEQKQRTKQVEREIEKMANRLERDKIASVAP